jgi:hypothetical protein
VRVFVDHRDFRRGADEAAGGRFEPDWGRLTQWLGAEAVSEACGVSPSALRYEGTSVYVAVTRSVSDRPLRSWATTELSRVPGVSVLLAEVEGEGVSLCGGCEGCGTSSSRCGSGAKVAGGEAVADAIRADLLRLSREDVFDWAVVVASDRRLAAAARFLITRGHKVVHAGFPPRGRELAAACLASIDLRPHVRHLESA